MMTWVRAVVLVVIGVMAGCTSPQAPFARVVGETAIDDRSLAYAQMMDGVEEALDDERLSGLACVWTKRSPRVSNTPELTSSRDACCAKRNPGLLWKNPSAGCSVPRPKVRNGPNRDFYSPILLYDCGNMLVLTPVSKVKHCTPDILPDHSRGYLAMLNGQRMRQSATFKQVSNGMRIIHRLFAELVELHSYVAIKKSIADASGLLEPRSFDAQEWHLYATLLRDLGRREDARRLGSAVIVLNKIMRSLLRWAISPAGDMIGSSVVGEGRYANQDGDALRCQTARGQCAVQ